LVRTLGGFPLAEIFAYFLLNYLMASVLEKTISVAEYLERERTSEVKHEYLDGMVREMSGASREHNIIATNISRELDVHLETQPCEIYGSDMRVRVTPTRYTYPDLTVVCETPFFEDSVLDTLLNPLLMIEILSPSTEAYDRGDKFSFYRRIESLQEFVFVGQDKPKLECYFRQGREWRFSEAVRLDDVVRLETIDLTLSLARVYKKLTFPVDAAKNV
jgi:Uma2 family endonuclease